MIWEFDSITILSLTKIFREINVIFQKYFVVNDLTKNCNNLAKRSTVFSMRLTFIISKITFRQFNCSRNWHLANSSKRYTCPQPKYFKYDSHGSNYRLLVAVLNEPCSNESRISNSTINSSFKSLLIAKTFNYFYHFT